MLRARLIWGGGDAQALLEAARPALTAVAQALLAQHTLSGVQVEQILAQHPPAELPEAAHAALAAGSNGASPHPGSNGSGNGSGSGNSRAGPELSSAAPAGRAAPSFFGA